MSKNCSVVIFSNKAYNSIIRETFDKHPVETGGILLGHVIDDAWVVMEVLPPGINSIFEPAYFEYDHAFVNYLADSVASQYKQPLSLLGLWHRHPGSMDVFSTTDDVTNRSFAALRQQGTISGLINVDPDFRITMYHLDKEVTPIGSYHRPQYEKVDVEVGDDIIPEHFFELKYYNSSDDEQHPRPRKEHQGRASNIGIGQNNEIGENDATPDGNDSGDDSPRQLKRARTSDIVDELLARTGQWLARRAGLIILLVLSILAIVLISPKKSRKTAPNPPKHEWNFKFWKKGKGVRLNDTTYQTASFTDTISNISSDTISEKDSLSVNANDSTGIESENLEIAKDGQ